LKFTININNNLLGFLEGGTHSLSTSMTIVSSMAFGFTPNIFGEEKCNSKA
jgi:hypothetical protein